MAAGAGIDSDIGGVALSAVFEELGHWSDARAQSLSNLEYSDPAGDEGARFALAATAAVTNGLSGGKINLGIRLADGGTWNISASSAFLKLSALASVNSGRIFENNTIDGVQMWGPGGHFGTTFVTAMGVGQGFGNSKDASGLVASGLAVASQIADMFSKYDAASLWGDKYFPGNSNWTREEETHLRTMFDGLHGLPATEAEATTEWLTQERNKTADYVVEQMGKGQLIKAGIALHRFGDLYAHVQSDGRPYWGDRGHGLSGSIANGTKGHEPDMMYSNGRRFNATKVEAYQKALAGVLSRGFVAAGWNQGRGVEAGIAGGVTYFDTYYKNGNATSEAQFVNNIINGHTGYELPASYDDVNSKAVGFSNNPVAAVARALSSRRY